MSDIKLEVGDVVQLDGGEHIVEKINGDKAHCLPMTDRFKGIDRRGLPKDTAASLPRHLLLRRAGIAGLEAFRNHKPVVARPHDSVVLELGDELQLHGHCWTVTEKRGAEVKIEALFEDDAKGERCAERWFNETVKEFYLPGHGTERKSEKQRLAHLKDFLSQKQSLLAETIINPSDEEETMSKSKAKPAKAGPKQSQIQQQPPPRPVGNPGRGRLGSLYGTSVVRVIMACGARGMTKDEVKASLAKKGIEAKDSTIAQNLRVGKKDKQGATLTKDDWKDFLS